MLPTSATSQNNNLEEEEQPLSTKQPCGKSSRKHYCFKKLHQSCQISLIDKVVQWLLDVEVHGLVMLILSHETYARMTTITIITYTICRFVLLHEDLGAHLKTDRFQSHDGQKGARSLDPYLPVVSRVHSDEGNRCNEQSGIAQS
jgi:hypothetical protein